MSVNKILSLMASAALLAAVGLSPLMASKGNAATGENTPAQVEGFRSAKFGMTEDEVRKAMRADLGVKNSQIQREENPLERTTVLTADVRDVLPGAGPARISYVLGFNTKKLIHVNVLWARELGASMDQLGTAVTSLQVYFSGQTYKSDSMVANAPLPDGSILAFRASDAKERMVLLVASGMDPKDDKIAVDKAFVRLSYVLSPSDPDIFKLKPGSF